MSNQKSTHPAKRKSVWYWIIAAAMAVIFLILAIRGVSWDEMIQTVCQSDPGLLVFVFLLITINLFFRGLRWGILLSGENPIQALTMFWATADGYLGNTLLPARAGELIRSAIVGIKTGIGTSYVFATAMTERIVDAVVLVLIGLILLPGITGLPDWVPTTLHVMAVVGVIGLLVIITLPYIERMLRKILSILPFPESWKTKLGELLGRFVLGTRAFINPVRAAGFLGLTPIIWMLDGYITVQVAKALSLSLTLSQALILMVALGLASALPSTPGYVGIYQYVATTILPVFGMSKSEALTFILLYQGMAVMAFLLWGLISLPVLNIRPAALRQLGEKQSTNEIDVS